MCWCQVGHSLNKSVCLCFLFLFTSLKGGMLSLLVVAAWLVLLHIKTQCIQKVCTDFSGTAHRYFFLFKFELNPAVYSLSLNDLVSDYTICFSCFSNIIIFSKLKLLFSLFIYCLLWNRKIEINDRDLIKWCVVDNSTHMFNVFSGFFCSFSFIFLCCNLKLLWFIFWAIGNNGSFTKLIPKQ